MRKIMTLRVHLQAFLLANLKTRFTQINSTDRLHFVGIVFGDDGVKAAEHVVKEGDHLVGRRIGCHAGEAPDVREEYGGVGVELGRHRAASLQVFRDCP
jgi:hypothetical protein